MSVKDMNNTKDNNILTTKTRRIMKRVFNLLVVDESGSMEIIRKQALMGINETLETIRKIEKAHQDLE